VAGSSAQISFAFLAKDAASKTIRALGSNLKWLGGVSKRVGKGLAIAFAAGVAALGTAIGIAAASVVQFTRAAIADEAAQSRLVAVLKTRKMATDANLASVDKLIAAGAKLAFTDDDIRAGLLTATQFTKKFTDAQKILAVAQDLARAKNISLEEATSIVGKAYQGNTKGLKQLGVEVKKGAKGLTVLTAVSKKFGGASAAYAETTQGKFESLKIAIDETKESVGGVFLNALKKVFGAIQPYVVKFLGEIQKRLPDLEKFVSKIADDLIRNLPGYIATAKREIPRIIKTLKDFFGEVLKFGKEAAGFLGKDGAVTGGLALIGAKIGGLKGALSGVLSKSFSDIGFGPFQSLLLGTVSSAVIAGMTEGLVGAATTKLIAAFALKMKLASTPSPVPSVGGGGGVSPLAFLGTGLGTIAASLTGLLAVAQLQFSLQDEAVSAMRSGKEPLWKTLVSPWLWPGAIGDLFRGQQPAFTLPGGAMTNDPMTAKYSNFAQPAFAGTYANPMTAKYSSPQFNVYVGAAAVADAVVPVLARDVSFTPRGGR
jgi:hypothetical protein